MANLESIEPSTHKTKEPGPGLWLSIITLTIGTIAVSWGAYAAFQSAFELLSIDSFETPGEQTRSLDPGDYEIYVRSASVAILDFDIEFDDEIAGLDQIRVVNEDTGEAVPLERLIVEEPLSRSANVYDAVAVFEVTTAGRYTVTVDSVEPSRAVFGRSIESALDRIGPWLIMAVVGLVLFVFGLAMLIIGLVRRKRHRDRQATSAGSTTGVTAYNNPGPPQPHGGAPVAPPPVPVNPPATPPASRPSPPPPQSGPRESETETPW